MSQLLNRKGNIFGEVHKKDIKRSEAYRYAMDLKTYAGNEKAHDNCAFERK